jgi:hypothetical protein
VLVCKSELSYITICTKIFHVLATHILVYSIVKTLNTILLLETFQRNILGKYVMFYTTSLSTTDINVVTSRSTCIIKLQIGLKWGLS